MKIKSINNEIITDQGVCGNAFCQNNKFNEVVLYDGMNPDGTKVVQDSWKKCTRCGVEQ